MLQVDVGLKAPLRHFGWMKGDCAPGQAHYLLIPVLFPTRTARP